MLVFQVINYSYSKAHFGRDFAFAQTFGQIRWIFIDSERTNGQQYEWISNELLSPSSKDAMFRIVLVHIAPFIEYWEPDGIHSMKKITL